MSTIVEILKSAEEVLLPDGRRVSAQREAALMQALRESLRLERQRLEHRRLALAGDARNYAGVRDMDMGHSIVQVVGRATQSAKPVRSAKSAIVPEPDQIQSKRPEPRSVLGRSNRGADQSNRVASAIRR
jgi:hypothetical protein